MRLQEGLPPEYLRCLDGNEPAPFQRTDFLQPPRVGMLPLFYRILDRNGIDGYIRITHSSQGIVKPFRPGQGTRTIVNHDDIRVCSGLFESVVNGILPFCAA